MNEKRRRSFAQDILIIFFAIPSACLSVFLLQRLGREVPSVGTLINILIRVVNILFIWRIFEKAGIRGWKALIPVYRDYLLWQTFYRRGWLVIVIELMDVFVRYLRRSDFQQLMVSQTGWIGTLYLFMSVAGLALSVYYIWQYYRYAKAFASAFGKGKRFAFWGLILFQPVGMGIIAYDSSVCAETIQKAA